MFPVYSVFSRVAVSALLLTVLACAQSESEPKKATKSADKKQDKDAVPDNKNKKKTEDAGKQDQPLDQNEEEPDEPAGEPKEKQRIEFTGSKGDKVPGYLWLPAAKSGTKSPAILLMYGISDDKDSGTIGAAAKELAKKGYVSMTIDWPGTGERGSISKQDRIINASVKDWTVADYAEAVNFLAARPEVDAKKIAYVGASMGAMTGLAYAAKDTRIKALVAIVPIPNPLWGNDDPQSSIRAIAPRPVLCISTSDNSDLSGSVCGNNAGENKTLSGGHELSGMRGQVVELTEAFFKKHLN